MVGGLAVKGRGDVVLGGEMRVNKEDKKRKKNTKSLPFHAQPPHSFHLSPIIPPPFVCVSTEVAHVGRALTTKQHSTKPRKRRRREGSEEDS
jgi:hypothetical protein